MAAYAQDTAPPDELEEITVTGSRIPNANLISASPITEIGSEMFDLAGATRVEDLLNTYPQLAPSFDSFTVNPTTGFATADLRGLGTFRTLVLVNGNRLQPGGIRSEARDLNQIPAALIERVEVLTGGASAVYGSDAMAGVVNFILDNDFEGLSIRAGMSGYQHDNDDGYVGGLLDDANFENPQGGTGLDGDTMNIDIAMGSSFAGERGHAMGYFTWRDNDELLQGTRDYSACALNAGGTVCGGSSTAPVPNFLVFADDYANFAHLNDDGSWGTGIGELYNFAPINHYQRPDERYTFGGSLSYESSEFFKPYIESMFATTSTSVQIAESGTFFVNLLQMDCADPLLGSMCGDLGINPAQGLIDVYVGKRNTEGGPRIAELDTSSFRVVAGAEGRITDDWSYNVSYLIGRTSSSEANVNDLLSDRVGPALLQCPPGSPSGCIPYNVWVPGGVTVEAASGLSGTGIRSGHTQLTAIGGYVSGITPFVLPTADTPVSLVAGYEYRKDEYVVRTDANMQSGNFTGLGGPRLPIDGSFDVNEIYMEAGIPLLEDKGALQALALDIGYRYSDYDTSGGASTWKAGVSAQVTDMVRLRGSFNRAIRAPNSTELFRDQQISLWGGDDPCAVEAADIGTVTPEFTPEQCANTGVSAAQYGTILASPAAQYNQHSGGNPDLQPEEADTVTLGFVLTPIDRLDVSVDYFDIDITDRVGSIGAETVLRFCGLTGDPFLCGKVNRNPSSGDLWVGSSLQTSGFVENLDANFGDLRWRGVDLLSSYDWDMFGGSIRATLVGTYMIEQEVAPLPGVNDDATFDCSGVINPDCQQPSWRHNVRFTYSRDRITGSIGWRYIGEMDYETTAGEPATTDQLLVDNGGKLDAWNYLDLSGVFAITDFASVTLGVQNVLDKQPPVTGSTVTLNGNSPGGYDQMGRFIHATLNLDFESF
jgi:outer membrane receptor protein involved in Fe transport